MIYTRTSTVGQELFYYYLILLWKSFSDSSANIPSSVLCVLCHFNIEAHEYVISNILIFQNLIYN